MRREAATSENEGAAALSPRHVRRLLVEGVAALSPARLRLLGAIVDLLDDGGVASIDAVLALPTFTAGGGDDQARLTHLRQVRRELTRAFAAAGTPLSIEVTRARRGTGRRVLWFVDGDSCAQRVNRMSINLLPAAAPSWTPPGAVEKLEHWIGAPGARVALLTGDAGTGKSACIETLVRRVASPSLPVFLFDLGGQGLGPTPSLEDLIQRWRTHWRRGLSEPELGARAAALEIERGALIIVERFEYFACRYPNHVQGLGQELLRAVHGPSAQRPRRLLVTCRRELFAGAAPELPFELDDDIGIESVELHEPHGSPTYRLPLGALLDRSDAAELAGRFALAHAPASPEAAGAPSLASSAYRDWLREQIGSRPDWRARYTDEERFESLARSLHTIGPFRPVAPGLIGLR